MKKLLLDLATCVLCVVFVSLTVCNAVHATTPPPTKPIGGKNGSHASSNSHSSSRVGVSVDSVGHGGSGGSGGNGGNASANGGSANANQVQSQTQTATGGAGGASNQTQSANNAGNAQNTSISTSVEDRLQAPNVFAPAVYASGPCAYGWSAGLSVPGGGISGGKAKPDASCDRRELARVLTPLNPQLALKILCADPIAAAVATGDDCVYHASANSVRVDQVNGTPPSASSSTVTKQEVSEAIDRAFKKTVSK